MAYTEAVDDLELAHYWRLRNLLFGSGNGQLPDWLDAVVNDCTNHYRGCRTTREFQAALNGFTDLKMRPFELFVVGEGNYGKSTLLNALLGCSASRVNHLPETPTFIRAVLSGSPSDAVRLYVRCRPGIHDWIRPHLTNAKLAADMADCEECVVPGDVADTILREEAARLRRCGDGSYEAAVVEAEREIRWSPRAALPVGFRLVDTQGLNQQFGRELYEDVAAKQGSSTTRDRMRQWLRSNDRGRHFASQYRRCDAVLWLAKASQVNSAATSFCIEHFSQYGKRIVLAVTRIDEVGGLKERERVIELARRTYARHVKDIFPVNAKLAAQSAATGDARLAESGLLELSSKLREYCVDDGARTRAVSQYVSLRRTETQLRQALFSFHAELRDNIDQFRAGCELLEQTYAEARRMLINEIEQQRTKTWEWIASNANAIGLSDDGNSAQFKLRLVEAAARLETGTRVAFGRASHAIEEVGTQLAKAEYRLPEFTIEGDRRADSIRVQCVVTIPTLDLRRPSLSVVLESQRLDAVYYSVRGFFAWLFTDGGVEARRERAEVESRRRADVLSQVEREWKPFCDGVAETTEAALTAIHTAAAESLRKVEQSLERVEDESLERTCRKLESALSRQVVKPAFLSTLAVPLARVAGRISK